MPVEALHGGFLLVARSLWQDLGGLDASYFLYGEDVDLCKRVRNRGGRIGLVPASRIFHDVGSGDVFSPTRKRFSATGTAHYLRKHSSPAGARVSIGLLWMIHISRFVGGKVLSMRGPRYRSMAAGFAQNALKPWTWMGGFAGRGADPRRTDD